MVPLSRASVCEGLLIICQREMLCVRDSRGPVLAASLKIDGIRFVTCVCLCVGERLPAACANGALVCALRACADNAIRRLGR